MEPLSKKRLEQIRRRYDEYTPSGGSGYRNFYHAAHEDMGRLLDEIDRLRVDAFDPAIDRYAIG